MAPNLTNPVDHPRFVSSVSSCCGSPVIQFLRVAQSSLEASSGGPVSLKVAYGRLLLSGPICAEFMVVATMTLCDLLQFMHQWAHHRG